MLVVGFIIAFILAFGIGANDVANSFGTSVGSKVLTMKWACILASIFETMGAILLGSKVSDTIRKGIIDVDPYVNNTGYLMMGNVAALSGSCVWLMGATLLRLPISATHSIVGATIGFALVAHGVRGINWMKLGMIIGSWFASPILAGLVSTAIFYLCKYKILNKKDPLESGLRFLPVFYAATILINLFSVFYDGPAMLGLNRVPLWGTAIISFGSGILCAIIVPFFVVPWQRKRIRKHCQYTGAYKDNTDENSTKFKFEDNKMPYSANSSLNSSINNSRRNSFDCNSEKAILKTVIELEEMENQKNVAPNLLALPGSKEDGATRDGNAVGEKKDSVARSKISKAEDALLVDNEYKLGRTTPVMDTTTQAGGKNGTANNLATREDSAVKLVVDVDNSNCDTSQMTALEKGRSAIEDRPETARLFSFLQILTAIFGSFAHGGNDVSNAIGPLVSLWLIGTTGTVSAKALTPIWILFYGGVGISLGLWIWGRRVIKTMGEDLTKITPSSGFCIEIGSALTVLIASNIGIPISTTHCKVGSVVFVGHFRSRENVDWSIFRNIVLAWLVTLPIAGGISAAIMAGMREVVMQQ
ncbi:Sodium-dependent phosphate transporter 1 [Lamellibrachia satsuma]|nr:Sodium-dependent phosphate transporter 1 [Lamellibrachia satsuma]